MLALLAERMEGPAAAVSDAIEAARLADLGGALRYSIFAFASIVGEIFSLGGWGEARADAHTPCCRYGPRDWRYPQSRRGCNRGSAICCSISAGRVFCLVFSSAPTSTPYTPYTPSCRFTHSPPQPNLFPLGVDAYRWQHARFP
jgi:hypothetical protein